MSTVQDHEIEITIGDKATLLRWRPIGESDWQATPYQYADAGCDPQAALKLVNDWLEG